MKKSINQQRAKNAFEQVKKLQENNNDSATRSNYVSYVENLPTMILINGLGQAMATLLAQVENDETDPHYLLYDHVQKWLCRDDQSAPFRGKKDLMEAIVSSSREEYIKAQAEALAYLEWLKKFAVAFLKPRDGKGEE